MCCEFEQDIMCMEDIEIPMYGVIYKYTNKLDNMMYVGQHKCFNIYKFKRDHTSNKLHFDRSYKKHGKENFIIVFLEIVYSKQEADEKERYYIKLYNTHSKVGYNKTDGGDGPLGRKHTPEEIQHLHEINVGKNNHFHGCKHKQESLNRIRRNRKGKCCGSSNWQFGKPSTFKGKHQSREWIEAHSGAKSPISKLTEDDVAYIRSVELKRGTRKLLAKQFHVSRDTIYRVLKYTHYK